MANLSKTERLKRYRHWVDQSRRWRQEEQYDSLWERMIDLYRGRQVLDNPSNEDRIVVNIAFGTINVIYPSVSVNHPKITVGPTKPEDEDKAIILEALTNHEWRTKDYQDEFRESVKDFLLIGHGWIKVGYVYEETQVPEDPRDLDKDFAERKAEAEMAAMMNPEMAHELPTDEEIRGHLTETKIIVEKDQPFVERVSPFDMFIDPMAVNERDLRWLAQRVRRPLEEVKEDERYNKGARKRLKGDLESHGHDQRRLFRRRQDRDDREWITIWEFYDLSRREMCVFGEGSEEFLVDPQPVPFAGGHPYVFLPNYEVPDQFYPMGDLEAIEGLQLELNKTRSQMMQARKKFARKYLFRKRAFTKEGRDALESDKDNELVEVSDENQPFDHLIYPLQQVPLPPDLYNHSEQVEMDIGTVTGVSEYQRGQVPETRRTATEAAIISDSVTARAADKLAMIENCLSKVARRVVQMLQQFTEGEHVFRVVGIDGANIWVPWDRDEISGEYDFEVEGGSTQPPNDTVRRQTAVALMQTLAPFVEAGVVNPWELVRHVLQYGFDIKKPEKFMMDPNMMMGPEEGDPHDQPGMPGMQEPPMGGGYIDDETGDHANQVPPEILDQLTGQLGMGLMAGEMKDMR
jgi:hypothetical protein